MTHPKIQPQQNPELWKPAGMPEWKVGMRVRWRISSECDWSCGQCGRDWHEWHPSEGEGVLRRILDTRISYFCHNCGSDFAYKGHVFCVDRDGYPHTEGFWAAASELILLSDEGRER